MIKSFLIVFSLLTLSSTTFAGNAEKGKKLYGACIQCHGDRGEGLSSQEAPRIGGQHEWYILASLKAFKSNKRSNPKMLPFIKNLSDTDFADLATYVATLK